MKLTQTQTFSLVFILLAFGSLSSCTINKYDEGPFLSFYTAEERVKNTWIWSYYEENGSNLTGLYVDSTLSIESNQVAKIIGPDAGFREGTWQLISKNNQFQLIFGDQAYAYDILMLKEKEMWLELNDSANNFSQDWQLKEQE